MVFPESAKVEKRVERQAPQSLVEGLMKQAAFMSLDPTSIQTPLVLVCLDGKVPV